jgi:anthranilate synthase component 2
MVIVIDNYDSFTFNLVQRLGEIDGDLDIRVFRNDQCSVDEIVAMQPSRLNVSPGPCTPNEAGISVPLIQRLGGRCRCWGSAWDISRSGKPSGRRSSGPRN